MVTRIMRIAHRSELFWRRFTTDLLLFQKESQNKKDKKIVVFFLRYC